MSSLHELREMLREHRKTHVPAVSRMKKADVVAERDRERGRGVDTPVVPQLGLGPPAVGAAVLNDLPERRVAGIAAGPELFRQVLLKGRGGLAVELRKVDLPGVQVKRDLDVV